MNEKIRDQIGLMRGIIGAMVQLERRDAVMLDHYLKRIEAALPRWIPVEERLPDNGRYVLARRNKYLPAVAMWHEMKKVFSVDGESCTGFTHWMPIPDLRR